MGDETRDETVGRLLKASLSAHERAKFARSQRRTDEAAAELTSARALRIEAHAADPDHTSLLWAAESVDHEIMIQFYNHKLGGF